MEVGISGQSTVLLSLATATTVVVAVVAATSSYEIGVSYGDVIKWW